jgi:hypothetical protein
MKRIKNRPLINPKNDSFHEQQEGSVKEDSQEVPQMPREQLGLKIDSPMRQARQRVGGARYKVRRRLELIETSAIWKTPAFPFAIVSSAFSLILMLSIIIFSYDDLPKKLPLIYNTTAETWNQIDKTAVVFFAIFLFTIQFLVINMGFKIFRSDKRLSITVAWMLSFVNFLLLIAVIQVYSLSVNIL